MKLAIKMQGSGQPPKLVPENLGRLKAFMPKRKKETHVEARQGVMGQGLPPHAGYHLVHSPPAFRCPIPHT
ncbi:hypothetical protein ACQP3L_39410, partial [Escherichia coli]